MSRIKFLNTYIDSLTVSEAKARVDEMVQKRTPQYVVTPNTDIVMRMQREPDLLEICNKADLILTDGEMLVKLSKFLGNPIKERVAMTDFVWDVCDLAVEKKYRVFLFGGKESVLEKGKERIQNKYLNLNICRIVCIRIIRCWLLISVSNKCPITIFMMNLYPTMLFKPIFR